MCFSSYRQALYFVLIFGSLETVKKNSAIVDFLLSRSIVDVRPWQQIDQKIQFATGRKQ